VRYRVNGLEIRSENAAKPVGQASAYLVKWLNERRPVSATADVGCGKLRYAGPLLHFSRAVTFVDSDVQLSRVQVLHDERTTIRDYVPRRWSGSRALSVAEFESDPLEYDFILCANVLSAIPDVEARVLLLRTIKAKLRADAECLLVSQFRNSYFTSKRLDSGTFKYLDGWVTVCSRGASFYGLIDPAGLSKTASAAGLKVRSCWRQGQSGYLVASA
jgi:2-polyprenyl-3-methyl-5-hydroxy-6-metoxy-1,4-benzoquinol methylase